MTTVHRNRLSCAITNAPGTSGALIVGTAQSGYRTFVAADDGKQFDVEIQDGTAWEVRTGCTYTHSGTSLARGTLEDSSTGSAIALSSSAIVTECLTAGKGTALEQQLDRQVIDVTNDGTTTQTLTSAAWTKLTSVFTTVNANGGTQWDATNKKFTAGKTGWYDFNFSISNTIGGAGTLYAALYKNTVSVKQSQPNNSSYNCCASLTCKMYLTQGDVIEAYAYSSAGGTTQASSANAIYFQVSFLSAS